MKKWLLSTTLATLILTGCIPSCGTKENEDSKKLREFTQELNTYANETYKSKNASCTDYGIKRFSLITMKDDGFRNKLTIEIKDNKPLVETNVGAGIIILKNELIDILNSKDSLKKNIDTYIDSCNSNSSNKTDTIKSISQIFEEMNMPVFLSIKNGIKFNISDNETATIVNGKMKCEKNFLDSNIEFACTELHTLNGSNSKVNLFLKGQFIEEIWTTKNIDGKIFIIRPNGYNVQVIRDNK